LIIDPSISFFEYLDAGNGPGGIGTSVKVNAAGIVYIAGYDLNFGNGSYDAVAKRFDSACVSGGCTRWMTSSLAAGGDDRAKGIALDTNGDVWLIGSTMSTTFPTLNPLKAANSGGSDAFIAKLSGANLALQYSTYFGG